MNQNKDMGTCEECRFVDICNVSRFLQDHVGEYLDSGILNTVGCNTDFKPKPQTITIGDMEVPKPCTVPPKIDATYYFSAPANTSLYGQYIWNGDIADKRLLQLGLVHLTKEAAIRHAAALIKMSGGTI